MNLHNQSCLTYLEGYNVFTLLFPCQVNISKFACVILNKERTWSWETALSTNGVCMFFISLSNMRGSPKNSHKRQRAKIRARLEIWCVHAKLTRNQPFPSGLPISKSSNDQQVLLNNEIYLNIMERMLYLEVQRKISISHVWFIIRQELTSYLDFFKFSFSLFSLFSSRECADDLSSVRSTWWWCWRCFCAEECSCFIHPFGLWVACCNCRLAWLFDVDKWRHSCSLTFKSCVSFRATRCGFALLLTPFVLRTSWKIKTGRICSNSLPWTR